MPPRIRRVLHLLTVSKISFQAMSFPAPGSAGSWPDAVFLGSRTEPTGPRLDTCAMRRPGAVQQCRSRCYNNESGSGLSITGMRAILSPARTGRASPLAAVGRRWNRGHMDRKRGDDIIAGESAAGRGRRAAGRRASRRRPGSKKGIDHDQASHIYAAPGHLVRRLHQIAVSIFLEQTRGFRITPVQYSALSAIRAFPGSTSAASRASSPSTARPSAASSSGSSAAA